MIYSINKQLLLEFSWDDMDKPISDSSSNEHINTKSSYIQPKVQLDNDSKLIKNTYKMNIDKLDNNRIKAFKSGFNASLRGD